MIHEDVAEKYKNFVEFRLLTGPQLNEFFSSNTANRYSSSNELGKAEGSGWRLLQIITTRTLPREAQNYDGGHISYDGQEQPLFLVGNTEFGKVLYNK